jgi:hypothetical protein
MRPQVLTRSAAGATSAFPVDWRQGPPFSIGLGAVVAGGSTLTYSIQHTFDDVFDPSVTPFWFDHDVLTAQTTSQDGNYAYPIRAIRLNVTAFTSGSVSLTILQS